MSTFADLLTKHIERAGISDAELARGIGVRRQTVFRWKEGLVARPRHRADVLRCADRLRLTAAERDEFLLVAGFAPEAPQHILAESKNSPVDAPPNLAEATHDGTSAASASAPPVDEASPDGSGDIGSDSTASTASARLQLAWRDKRVWIGGVAALWICIFLAVTFWRMTASAGRTPPSTPTSVAIVAAPGETLLLVAQFANYAQVAGYNVAGRLQSSLRQQIKTTELGPVRVHIWPEPIAHAAHAATVLDTSRATMLIWGEYDSGRVVVNFTTQGAEATDLEKLVPSPDELSPVINFDVPQEVRSLALITLGRLYRSEGELAPARAAFNEALALDLPDDTRGKVYFYLASVHAMGDDADLNVAIDAYTRAIALRPGDVNALYNRGKVYLDRYRLYEDGAGEINGGNLDLNRAIADLSRTIQRKPAYAAAYTNRGIAYYVRDRPGDIQQALADLDNAIELTPDGFANYYNRALVHIRADNPAGWQTDLARVLEMEPSYAAAYAALCWGYVLDQQPREALRYCQRAQERAPDSGNTFDSMGLAYVQLGQPDRAIAQFEAYLDWLYAQPPGYYERYNGPLVESWITALRAGQNPIDAAVLDSLR